MRIAIIVTVNWTSRIISVHIRQYINTYIHTYYYYYYYAVIYFPTSTGLASSATFSEALA